MTIPRPVVLTAEIKTEIDHWLTKFPVEQKRSAVLFALRLVQEANGGSLTQALMDAVAEYLVMPSIAVYEVATFYSLYEHAPVGRYKIAVCTNISCMLKGSDKIVNHIESRLGVRMGETTADELFTLREVECLAACAGAPMFQVNDRTYYENLTIEKVDQILAELTQASVEGPSRG